MLWLIASAAASDVWDCDSETFTSLQEMRSWYDAVAGHPDGGLTASLEAWRDSLLDASRVPVDCSYTDQEVREMLAKEGSHSCERYACVTGSGVAIAWSTETWSEEATGWLDETNEYWTVSTADGTSVSVYGYSTSEWNRYLDSFDDSSGESVSWTGTPIADLPADSSYSAGSSSTMDGFGYGAVTYGWSTSGCTIRAGSSTDEWPSADRSVTVGGQEGEVDYENWGCYLGFFGQLDGTFMGLVDGTTWERDPADADGDGMSSGSDCDDADATVNPCADDDTVDGIDQDCDGTDGS